MLYCAILLKKMSFVIICYKRQLYYTAKHRITCFNDFLNKHALCNKKFGYESGLNKCNTNFLLLQHAFASNKTSIQY